MYENINKSREEIGYRKGVLLGLTVAEIILLILFALLLALWGQIYKMKSEVERAKVINNRFLSIIEKNDKSPNASLTDDIEKLIKIEIDYSFKLAKELEKYKKNLLPDDVFELIKSQNFDLNKSEDREKFFKLVTLAKQLATNSDKPIDKFVEQCDAGQITLDKFKGNSPDKVLSDLKHWKGIAETCGKGKSLPPCYQINGKDVAIFEVRLNDQGILLKNIVPDQFTEEFNNNFSRPPTYGVTLNKNDFREQTSQFIKYGRDKECKFRVNAFDDTGIDKKYFQEIEKEIDRVFFKWKNW
jgi:hypothetical protein